jgi:NADH-quinone oxidoreductase subunit M
MNEAYYLTLVWLMPLITSLLTFPIKRENHKLIKQVNAIGSGINLLFIIFLTVKFIGAAAVGGTNADGFTTKLYFAVDVPWLEVMNIHYNIGVDGLSILMMLLTGMIIFAGVFASWGITDRAKEFFILLNILVTGVYGVFISFDLFTFFLFYEVAVLPMYLLIGVWGSTRKEYSSMKLTIMLVGASSLLFAGIFGLYFESGLNTFDLNQLSQVRFSQEFQNWAFPVLFVGFGVLGALFPFHTWSPDGHAAAPTAVSMLHAGVLMKLGGYGILRVAMYVLPEGAREWMGFFMILVTINVAYGAFVAIRQKDLKYITAYSSVSHLGLVLLALAAMTFTGMKGSTLQMISHGLLTGLFFALIGMIYGRTHTRMVTEMGGLMKVMPFLGVSFFIAGLAGLGLPGLSGFVAEATIFIGAFENPDPAIRISAILAILTIVTTAVYVMRSANRMLTGPLNEKFADLTDANGVEKTAVLIMMTGLFGMGLLPGWIADLLDACIRPIFNNLMR